MADGAGTALASLFGAMPNTSFSQNVGVIAFTGVMSRHVVTIGAIFLVLAGLIPKLGAILRGAMAAPAGPPSPRRVFLKQLSAGLGGLTLGIGLPQVPQFVQFFPTQLGVVMKSGIVPAGIFALVMDRILPRAGA